MIDVRELERRWIRYKIKRYLPFAILFISLALIIIILFNIDFQKSNSHTDTVLQENRPVKKEQQRQQTTVAKESPRQIIVKKSTTPSASQEPSKILQPSMEFLRKIKENTVVPAGNQTIRQQYQKNYSSVEQSTITNQESSTLENDTEQTTLQKQKVKIKINKISKKELQALIKRFKKNNNPSLGVFIAKKYYEMGEYRKAYNYALITNQIDNTLEESWLIFTKSLVKLGHKDRAVKTLRAYIDVSHSSKASILLENILTGKFK